MTPSEVNLKWIPAVDEDRCTGCERCVTACGPGCLKMIEGIARLTEPDLCGSEEHCIAACQDDAIHMVWRGIEGDLTVGCWRRR